MQNKQEDVQQSKQRSTQLRPGSPTTEIINEDGQAIAWDLIEESSRAIGIPATAAKYHVNGDTILKRKRLKKWKGVPDGRSLAKVEQGSSEQLTTTPGDFTDRIPGFRERVFKKANDSIGKFKAKAPKTFKELDSASKIAERMMGIGEQTGNTAVLVHINEAINQHDPDSLPLESKPNESQEQGNTIDATLLPERSETGEQASPGPMFAVEQGGT